MHVLFRDLFDAIQYDNQMDQEYDSLSEKLDALFHPKRPDEKGLGELKDQSEEGYATKERLMKESDDMDAKCDASEASKEECFRLVTQHIEMNGSHIDWTSEDEDGDSLLYSLIFSMGKNHSDDLQRILQQLMNTEQITLDQVNDTKRDMD